MNSQEKDNTSKMNPVLIFMEGVGKYLILKKVGM